MEDVGDPVEDVGRCWKPRGRCWEPPWNMLEASVEDFGNNTIIIIVMFGHFMVKLYLNNGLMA